MTLGPPIARRWRAVAADLPLDTWTAWPLPLALGFAGGIGLRATGLPLVVGLPVAVGFATLAARGEGRLRHPIRLGRGGAAWIAVRATHARRRARLRRVAFVAIAVGLGLLRHAAWEHHPDPLSEHGPTVATVAAAASAPVPAPDPAGGDGAVARGAIADDGATAVLRWTGRSDGRVLVLDEPPGVRVALTPRDAAPAGRVVLEGALVAPEPARTPGGYDDLAYLRNRGIDGRIRIASVLEHAPAAGLRPWILRRAVDALERRLRPDAAALVSAMTLGVRDELGDTRDTFAAAGLAHVLALSGLHIGVLVAALAWALRSVPRLRGPLILLALIGFVALVGPTPSVVRAASMAVAGLVLVASGRGRRDIPAALGIAALGALAAHPRWLFDLGFQLSYLAVAGLLALGGPIARIALRLGTLGRVRRLAAGDPRAWVATSVAASIAAQIYALPIVLSTFGAVPLLSPLVNVVGVPLASLLVPVGFATAALGVVAPPWLAGVASAPFAWATGRLADALLGLASLASHGPQLAWNELGTASFAVYGAAMVAATAALRGRWRLRSALLVVAAALGYGAAVPAPVPELIVLDVGQGDAILLRLGRGREVLIDGGGTPFSDYDVGGRTVVPALRALGVDALEVVVATHADADHIEGLRSVLEAVPVGELWVGHPSPERPLYAELVETAEARGVPIRRVRRGERARLGRATFDVLHPGSEPTPGNDGSVALLVRWDGRPAALTLGDLSGSTEADLPLPPTPVLVVAHHGSPHSTSPELVAAARPRLAVISVGVNSYGHPSAEVVARLEAGGAEVRITRRDGTVRVQLVPTCGRWPRAPNGSDRGAGSCPRTLRDEPRSDAGSVSTTPRGPRGRREDGAWRVTNRGWYAHT